MSYIQTLFLSSFCAFVLSILELGYFYYKTTIDVKTNLDQKTKTISKTLSEKLNNISDPKIKGVTHLYIGKLRHMLNMVREKSASIEKKNQMTLINGISISIKILLISIVSFIFTKDKSFLFSTETIGSVIGIVISFIMFQLFFFNKISEKYASITNDEIVYSILTNIEPYFKYMKEYGDYKICKD